MAGLAGGEVKRTRKQVINQLVRQELVEDRKQLSKKPTKKKKVHSDCVDIGRKSGAKLYHKFNIEAFLCFDITP